MKADQQILKQTVEHFIFLQPHTTSQKIKGYFDLESIKDFYTLLKDNKKLKHTIETLCTKSGIELDYFRMIYEVYYDSSIRRDKFRIEYLKHQETIAKAFRINT